MVPLICPYIFFWSNEFSRVGSTHYCPYPATSMDGGEAHGFSNGQFLCGLVLAYFSYWCEIVLLMSFFPGFRIIETQYCHQLKKSISTHGANVYWNAEYFVLLVYYFEQDELRTPLQFCLGSGRQGPYLNHFENSCLTVVVLFSINF